MSVDLQDVYHRLFAAYGPQHWWPGETKFEIVVGAVLVQNTAWRNVERAVANLREAGLLHPRKLYDLQSAELAELIRPAGYYQVKARRLRNLLRLIVERYDGSLEAMFRTSADVLREELLSVNGIGPETADGILLYAGGVPTFVVDAYALRVAARHGWVDLDVDYHGLKEFFEGGLPPDAALFNEYHALLVRVGKAHCGKTPKCAECPLAELLPAAGPCSPEW